MHTNKLKCAHTPYAQHTSARLHTTSSSSTQSHTHTQRHTHKHRCTCTHTHTHNTHTHTHTHIYTPSPTPAQHARRRTHARPPHPNSHTHNRNLMDGCFWRGQAARGTRELGDVKIPVCWLSSSCCLFEQISTDETWSSGTRSTSGAEKSAALLT